MQNIQRQPYSHVDWGKKTLRTTGEKRRRVCIDSEVETDGGWQALGNLALVSIPMDIIAYVGSMNKMVSAWYTRRISRLSAEYGFPHAYHF
jgi:hypothetical protein